MADTSQPIFYTAPGNVPSVKTISGRLGVALDTAKRVRGVLRGTVDLMTCNAAHRRQFDAYNAHDSLTLALEAISEMIGGHGPEYIAHKDDGYRTSEMRGIEYVNMGDTYRTTILYNCKTRTWAIGCWGDIVERDMNAYA